MAESTSQAHAQIPSTLARLQRGVLGALALGAVAWFFVCWRAGRPWLGLAGALVFAFGHSLVLAVEFAMLLFVRRGDPAPRASALELLRAWAGECVWSWRVFCWEQPFRARRWPDLPGPRGQRGVIFVHGYFCNRGFWNPWLVRCHAQGQACIAVSLEPVFGELTQYVTQIEAAVARMEAATGLAPVLVGHSMGGLVLRAWLAGTPGAARRVHGVVTIGSPHQGTWMARWSSTANALAMRQGSAWLAGLARREAALGGALDAAQEPLARTCFWGHADNLVMPPSAALWPGAQTHHLRATAHVAMAFQPAVWAELLAALSRGSAASPASASPSPPLSPSSRRDERASPASDS